MVPLQPMARVPTLKKSLDWLSFKENLQEH